MVNYCVVSGCKKEWYPGCGLTFHKIPPDSERRNSWIQALKLENKVISKVACVCSLHFNDDDYPTEARRHLKQKAVPTLTPKKSMWAETIEENSVKCVKCNASTEDDPTVVLHRFPKPCPSNRQRTWRWAKYCFPEAEWYSEAFHKKLYKSHKMLCSKHFPEDTAAKDGSQNDNVQDTSPPELSPTGTSQADISDVEVEYLEDDEDLLIEENKNKLSEKLEDKSTSPIVESTLPEDKSTLPKDRSTFPKVKSTISDGSTKPEDESTIPEDIFSISTKKSKSIGTNIHRGPKVHYSRITHDSSKTTKRSIIEKSLVKDGIGIDDKTGSQTTKKLFYIDVKELRKRTCAICLSVGRKMYSMQHNDNLRTLQQFCERPFTPEHSICWECNATLSKFREFRRRVMDAQAHFDNDQQVTTPSLSRLKRSATTQVAITDEKQNGGGDSNIDEIIQKQLDTGLDSESELDTTDDSDLDTTDESSDTDAEDNSYSAVQKRAGCDDTEDDPPAKRSNSLRFSRTKGYSEKVYEEIPVDSPPITNKKQNSKIISKNKVLSPELLRDDSDESAPDRHQYSRTKERCFPCQTCPATFRSSLLLYKHRRSEHRLRKKEE